MEANLPDGLNEKSIIEIVTNGSKSQPKFGDKLSEEEIKDVSSYVLDQAVNEKWK